MVKHPMKSLYKRASMLLAVTLLISGLGGCKHDTDPKDTSSPTETVEITAPTIPTTQPQPEVINGTVNTDELNVREGVGISYDVVTTIKRGDRVAIVEQQDLNGVMWGRIEEGWICLVYVHIDGTPLDEKPEEESKVLEQPAVGKIIATELNIRTGPGMNHDVTGTLLKDSEVTVTELRGNWGKIEDGWINIIYAYFPDSLDATIIETKVNADDLNVRSGPSTSYESLRKIHTGAAVIIYKVVTIRDIQWGYIGDGWICMKYVEYQTPHPSN